jgi:hypothetical protein
MGDTFMSNSDIGISTGYFGPDGFVGDYSVFLQEQEIKFALLALEYPDIYPLPAYDGMPYPPNVRKAQPVIYNEIAIEQKFFPLGNRLGRKIREERIA